MPNFKKFLDANPTIKSAISVSGHIYYTPYFDGYNTIERMFIMDSNIVKKILDEDTDSNPLIQPCLCSGSLKYIHLDCLRQWIGTRNWTRVEKK